jgi:hemerythrin
MQDLNWKESYSVANKNIDHEHKNLFKLALKAFIAVGENEKIQKIKSIIHELMDYTKVHFHNEEDFMEMIKYPKLLEHKKIHNDIINSMNKFLKTINSKQLTEIEKDLARFVEFWFINHIVYEDKKIAQWIKSQNISLHMTHWKDEYKIGNALIDSEHQELFDIANEAFKNVPQEEKKKKISDTIAKLYKYIQSHFLHEEEYMKSLNYNSFNEHVLMHQNILNDLTNLIKNSSTFKVNHLEEKLLEFIDEGLVKHIVQEDMKIAKWLVFLKDLKEAKELKEID